jgi:hypothetical protein
MLKKLLTKINHNSFSILYLVCAIILSYLFVSTPEAFANLREIIALSLTKIGILYVSSFLLIKFLYKYEFDILREIFEENNIAAAIFVLGIMLSIAIVI